MGTAGPRASSAASRPLLRAARLLGAAEAVREQKHIQRPPREQTEHEKWIAALGASLGDAAFTAAQEVGRTLTWPETMRLALANPDGSEH